MQDLSNKLRRLLDAKRTQIEMVADRGFTVDSPNFPRESEYIKLSTDGFYKRLASLASKSNQETITLSLLNASYRGPEGRSLLAFYAGHPFQGKKVAKETIKYFIDEVKEGKFTDAILIVDTELSKDACKAVEADLSDRNITIFDLTELTYNIVRHVDTPKHTLLTPQEKFNKLKELKVDETKLPLININDPVVKYYGWLVGGLVKIERSDLNVGALVPRSLNYRIIIDNKT